MGLLWIAEAVLLGWLLVARWGGLETIRPRWARLLLLLGSAVAGGIGLTSCLFFVFGVLTRSPWVAMAAELTLLAWAAFEVFRRRNRLLGAGEAEGAPTGILLPILLVAVLTIATAAIATGWDANPQGGWDAWSIWNLRARFLAAGPGLAPRAWAPELAGITHPEYPLLVSGFIARCWTFSGFAMIVPSAVSYLFFVALIALVTGGVTVLRGPLPGLLAGMVVAASPALLHEVPAQYADVPVACCFAGAILFALLDRPVLAGIFAGFAAWTKDEGLLFLLLFLAALLAFRRNEALRALAGAVPAGLLALIFKLAIAHSSSAMSSGDVVHRLGDLSRYGAILAAFSREFAAMGAGWYHPIEPLIVAAVVLRFDRTRLREAWFAGSIGVALLLGYFGVYAITPNDLAWQLSTSLDRLLVQVWPVLVLAALMSMRAPETVPVTSAPSKKMRRKTKNASHPH